MYTTDEDINGKLSAGALGARFHALQERFGDVDENLRRLARERPLALLGGAVLVGFVLGRVMSR